MKSCNIGIGVSNDDTKNEIVLCEVDSTLKRKQYNYHLTLQTLSKEDTKDILYFLIPNKIDKSTYQASELIKHIRLFPDAIISKVPIQVDKISDKTMDEIRSLLTVREDASYYDSISPTSLLTNEEHNEIIKRINDGFRLSSSHAVTNLWGPYRILRQLHSMGYEVDDSYKNIKDDLSQEIKFKKMIYKDFQSDLLDDININPNEIKHLKNKLKDLQNRKIKIGVIDDEINNGWDKAYSYLCGSSNDITLDMYPQNTEKKSDDEREKIFEKYLDNIDKKYDIQDFDVILLDLRLYERTSNEVSDILDTKNISGIKLLRKIKKIDPTVSVVICTASNKSWNYEKVITLGANGYWSKESPFYGVSNQYSFHNILNLIDVIDTSYLWSLKIRKVYNPIVEATLKLNKKFKNSQAYISELIEKINIKRDKILTSINYLSDFNNDYNVTFIISYSLINEVVDFLIKKKKNDKLHRDEYYSRLNEKLTFCYKEDSNNYNLTEQAKEYISKVINYNKGVRENNNNFDDSNFILFNLSLINDKKDSTSHIQAFADKFNRLRYLRNHSILIHRREVIKSSQDDEISFQDVVDIINIYNLLLSQ